LDLLKTEGIFVGGSSGAAVDALKQYIEKHPKEKIAMAVLNFPDHGVKYMGKLYHPSEKAEQASDLF
jgi:cystathionine beta-synthase